MNRLNEDELYELHFRVCIAVVKRASFNYLTPAEIISPPHRMFDAYLARQIVTHLLVHKFGLVRKRVGALIGMKRTALNASIRTIDDRLDSDEFTKQYRVWARLSEDMFQDELAEAA